MDSYTTLRNDLRVFKHQAWTFLATRYSEDEINKLMSRLFDNEKFPFLGDLTKTFKDEGHPTWCLASLNALFLILIIEDSLPPDSSSQLEVDLYDLIRVSILAGMSLDTAFTMPGIEFADKFRNAGKLSKSDALGKVLEEIVKNYIDKHGKLPQYKAVVYELNNLANNGHKIIQEVDGEEEIIYWKGSGIRGETSYKQLRERLTKIRSKYSRLSG